MKASKILLLFVVLLSGVCMSGCSTDGDPVIMLWAPMKWQGITYGKTSSQGTSAYIFPAGGATLRFKCTNYDKFWLSQITITRESTISLGSISLSTHRFDDKKKEQSFSSIDGVSISVTGNELIVKFTAIYRGSRWAIISVSAGGISDTLNFTQSAEGEKM